MQLRLLVDDNRGRDRRVRERAGQMLLNDLRRVRVPAEPAEAPSEAGAKSGWGANLAELIIGGVMTGATVTAVTSVILAFVQRGTARSVTLVDGDRSIVVEAASREDQRMLLEQFLRGREPREQESTAAPSDH